MLSWWREQFFCLTGRCILVADSSSMVHQKWKRAWCSSLPFSLLYKLTKYSKDNSNSMTNLYYLVVIYSLDNLKIIPLSSDKRMKAQGMQTCHVENGQCNHCHNYFFVGNQERQSCRSIKQRQWPLSQYAPSFQAEKIPRRIVQT